MILKIKKDDFNWLYIETTKFSIHRSYDVDKLVTEVNESASYIQEKEHSVIKLVNWFDEPSNEPKKPLLTTIITDKCSIELIGEFTGFVLNDKGQTVERL